jgi:hypothetical protein
MFVNTFNIMDIRSLVRTSIFQPTLNCIGQYIVCLVYELLLFPCSLVPSSSFSSQVDEKQFDALMAARADDAPPPVGNGVVAVECNGYAAGRGSG